MSCLSDFFVCFFYPSFFVADKIGYNFLKNTKKTNWNREIIIKEGTQWVSLFIRLKSNNNFTLFLSWINYLSPGLKRVKMFKHERI